MESGKAEDTERNGNIKNYFTRISLKFNYYYKKIAENSVRLRKIEENWMTVYS